VSPLELTVRSRDSVLAVDRETWREVVGGGASPFADHRYLTALEASGCVGPGTGWLPRLLVASSDPLGRHVVGLSAAYLIPGPATELAEDRDAALILASTGGWLVIGAPFASARSERLWTHPALGPEEARATREALLRGAIAEARGRGCAGVHLLHAHPEEVAMASGVGFAPRLGIHYRWHNRGYRDFDAFLAQLSSHRRARIRRERRRVAAAGVTLESFSGAALTGELAALAHHFYRAAVGRYLDARTHVNAAFFAHLCAALPEAVHLTFARLDEAIVACALDIEKEGIRYGRYWGSDVEIDSLYFEVCAYRPIDEAIRAGARAVDVGPGGGRHKRPRGFEPEGVASAHLAFSPGRHRAMAAIASRAIARVERALAAWPGPTETR